MISIPWHLAENESFSDHHSCGTKLFLNQYLPKFEHISRTNEQWQQVSVVLIWIMNF